MLERPPSLRRESRRVAPSKLPRSKQLRTAAARPEGVGSPVLRNLDGRSAAFISKRLVVEARDDVQVRMHGLHVLVVSWERTPAQEVTVRRESLVLCSLRIDEQFASRGPLLSREIERR